MAIVAETDKDRIITVCEHDAPGQVADGWKESVEAIRLQPVEAEAILRSRDRRKVERVFGGQPFNDRLLQIEWQQLNIIAKGLLAENVERARQSFCNLLWVEHVLFEVVFGLDRHHEGHPVIAPGQLLQFHGHAFQREARDSIGMINALFTI